MKNVQQLLKKIKLKCNELLVQNKEPAQIAISALDEYLSKADAWFQPDISEYASEHLHKTQLNSTWFKKSNLSTKNGYEEESLMMLQNKSRAMGTLELSEKRQKLEKVKTREEYITVRENRERPKIFDILVSNPIFETTREHGSNG